MTAPNDRKSYDYQCGRCGSSMTFEECLECGGVGTVEDDDWQDYEQAGVPCPTCRGTGSWPICLSSEQWCREHPMPGRDDVERGTVDCFEVSDA
jgi:DnaJ-class molecular chaperone